MCFAFQHVISILSLAFREFIGDVFPLYVYTHARTHTHIHINFHLLWHCTLSTSEYILFFLVAFIKYMQYKKNSSLVDIINFSKLVLSVNQVLNKNSSNDDKQKKTSIQFRTKKLIFLETFGNRVT